MHKRIVGILGQARAGKDTVAEYLAREHGYMRIALADPMKRIVKEVFPEFTDAQLWGDDRDVPLPDGLTARFALQTIGSEWGRRCRPTVWIDYLLRTAKLILDDARAGYAKETGIVFSTSAVPPAGVAISDCRFRNEFDAVRAAGGFLVRVVRPGADGETGLAGIQGHASEAEQKSIPNDDFDAVIVNDGTKQDLYRQVETLVVRRL